VLRTLNKKHITGGPSAFLIPIRLQPVANPTISSQGTTIELQIGTRVFVDKPVLVDKDVDFILITKISPRQETG